MNFEGPQNLNENQKWHLEKEGLDARVRNLLGPLVSFVEIVKFYAENKDNEKGESLIHLMQDGYQAAINSFHHLQALAQETKKDDLKDEILRMEPLMRSMQLVSEGDRDEISNILPNLQNNQNIIQKIIKLAGQ